jgi:hypothetical protein
MHFSLGLIRLLQEKIVSDIMGEDGSPLSHRVRELILITSARLSLLKHVHDIIATFSKNLSKSQSNIFVEEQ